MNYKPWEVTKLLWSIKTMLNTLTKRYFQGGMSGLFYFELRVNCPQTMSIHQTMLRCPFESKKIWNSIAIALPTSWNCWPLSVTTQLTTYTQCCILMLQAILWQADLLTKTRGEQWSFFESDVMVIFSFGYSTITINWFSASRPLLSMVFNGFLVTQPSPLTDFQSPDYWFQWYFDGFGVIQPSVSMVFDGHGP